MGELLAMGACVLAMGWVALMALGHHYDRKNDNEEND